MNRSEFIGEIFKFFKNSDDDLKKSYDLAFSVKDNIDWDKLYRIVLKEAETRYLPSPKWFIDKFYRCNKIDNFNFANNQDTKVIITLDNDYQYDFEMFNCTLSKEKIIEGFNKKFNGKVKNIQFVKIDE